MRLPAGIDRKNASAGGTDLAISCLGGRLQELQSGNGLIVGGQRLSATTNSRSLDVLRSARRSRRVITSQAERELTEGFVCRFAALAPHRVWRTVRMRLRQERWV